MIYRIRGYHRGLGDQLMWSSLPSYLTELGHEVYLLDDPEGKQVQIFTNDEIKQLVWDYNPFIKGTSEGEWNAGDIVGSKYKNIHNNFIMNSEAMMGLEPHNSLPKIYYQPNLISGIEGLIELSAFTLKYDPEKVIQTTKEIMDLNPNIKFGQLVSQHQSNGITIPGIETIEAKSLFEVTDYIFSAKMFISLNSGTHMISCAIPHQTGFKQYCYLPEKDYDWIWRDRKFVLPGVIYLKV